MNSNSSTERTSESPSAENENASARLPSGEPKQEYLSGTKLAMIVTATILAIFLDALVSVSPSIPSVVCS